MDLQEYGYRQTMFGDIHEMTGIPARVTAVYKERYELISENGPIYGRLKAGVYYYDDLKNSKQSELYPTTGDYVRIQYNPSGDSVVIKTLERKSFFSRRDPTPGRGEQAVAANFDYVFIMASLNFDFNIRRLERYLTEAWQSGAIPVVVLTKADLVDDFSQQIREVQKMAAGVGVFAVSAKTGYGLDALSEYLKPQKTLVFLGSSGVGKSSLVNALAGSQVMAVNGIREDDSKGRHTTTHRQLIMLPSGVMIIDTPGMRELGMWDVSSGLPEAFADVEAFLGKCRFSDCRHQSEPGCAIKAALASGELSDERWNSYLKLKHEAKFVDDKTKALQEKWARNKSISKWSKQMKKQGEIRYE